MDHTSAQIIELGLVLSNLVNLVPHGLVIFFPSYAFLNSVKATFLKSGLLDKLNLKKKVRWNAFPSLDQ
jgi:chromosome transmission fidelity protein 1